MANINKKSTMETKVEKEVENLPKIIVEIVKENSKFTKTIVSHSKAKVVSLSKKDTAIYSKDKASVKKLSGV